MGHPSAQVPRGAGARLRRGRRSRRRRRRPGRSRRAGRRCRRLRRGRHAPGQRWRGRAGASHTVDYTGDVAAAVRDIAPGGVDKALHAAGDAAVVGQAVRAGGTVVSTLAATNEQLGRDDITATPIMAAATGDKLRHLLDELASGNLVMHVGTAIPLERAPEALTAFADGTLGKVVITR